MLMPALVDVDERIGRGAVPALAAGESDHVQPAPTDVHVNRGIVLDEHRRGLGAGAVVAGGEIAGRDVDGDPAEVDRLGAAEIDRAMRLHARGTEILPDCVTETVWSTVNFVV